MLHTDLHTQATLPLRRSCAVIGLLVAVILAGVIHLPRAEAAITGCRSDPIIVVNGAIADVVSILQTNPANIKELDYVITVPVGSLLGPTTLTVGLGFPEKVTYKYSLTQHWGTMSISGSVVTNSNTSPFATALQVTTLTNGTQTASGYSTTPLSVNSVHLIML